MPKDVLSAPSIWITWEKQRRNGELAEAFGADLNELDFPNDSNVWRYLKSMFYTLQILRSRPKIVFAQCPSLVLCVLLALLKPLFRFTFIVDAHNAIIRYLHTTGTLNSVLTKFFLRRTDFLIVTNRGLIEEFPIEKNRILILPDKLPIIERSALTPEGFSKTKPNIVFISSFAGDEPTLEFLRAAKGLESKARFFITGKKAKATRAQLEHESSEIIFTDYLSSQQFDALIGHADLNVDLTTLDNLLVCGAYETLAVSVPGILSDTRIQRETFKKGYIFTKCDDKSLSKAIEQSLENLQVLSREIKAYRADFITGWNEKFKVCLEKIKAKIEV